MVKSDYGFTQKYDDYDIKRRCSFAWDTEEKVWRNYATENNRYASGWWLRTPGGQIGGLSEYLFYATVVENNGRVNSSGLPVDDMGGNTGGDSYRAGVRLALYIKLKD